MGGDQAGCGHAQAGPDQELSRGHSAVLSEQPSEMRIGKVHLRGCGMKVPIPFRVIIDLRFQGDEFLCANIPEMIPFFWDVHAVATKGLPVGLLHGGNECLRVGIAGGPNGEVFPGIVRVV